MKRAAARKKKSTETQTKAFRPWVLGVVLGALVVAAAAAYVVGYTSVFGIDYYAPVVAHMDPPPKPKLDRKAYDTKLIELATGTTTVSTTTLAAFENPSTSTPQAPWPVHAAYPNYGALLPAHRIVAYYGNFYSKYMGVLGEYPEAEVLARLRAAVNEWRAADPSTPVIPGIDYIAVTAQGAPGPDGMYRARMPESQIDHALEMAKAVNGIVILDVQVGLSDLHKELPPLRKYLMMPQVNLAIDPEFSMQTSGMPPGKVIGTYDAKDINYAAQYLAKLVREYNLPPKILVVHRFTEDMVTNYKQIAPLPEVQIVMDMDGWGYPAKKVNTYNAVIASEPVQFTGFKLFYKQDLEPPTKHLMTPQEVLKLRPQPIFIQYQ